MGLTRTLGNHRYALLTTTMINSALIVANGTLPSLARLRDAIHASDFVVAADGGANALAALGISCDVVVGDFDSLSSSALPDVPRLPLPDQNFTDLDKAVAFVIEQGAASITMTGVTGSRLDHTFGALSVLVKYGRRVELALLDDVGLARLVVRTLTLTTTAGQTISLLPINAPTGVTTTGLRWNLTDEPLVAGQRDGTSNVAEGERVTVTAGAGDLVVYVHHVLT